MIRSLPLAIATLLLGGCATTFSRSRETIPSVAGDALRKAGIQYVDLARGSGARMANGKRGSGTVMRGWEIGVELMAMTDAANRRCRAWKDVSRSG